MVNDSLNVLLVDDDDAEYERLRRALMGSDPALQVQRCLPSEQPSPDSSCDVVLLDAHRLGLEALPLVEPMKNCAPDAPIVFVVGPGAHELAAKAIERGAQDYVVKDDEGKYLKLLPVVVHKAWDEKHARKRLQHTINHATENLARWVAHLEDRNDEVTLLNEMGQALQTCHQVEEAYAAAVRSIELLFPGASGALYMMKEADGCTETVATWGGAASAATNFDAADCPAVQSGRIHVVDESRPACRHGSTTMAPDYACVPLIAQSETLGVFHFRPREGMDKRRLKAQRDLAATVADHVALALSNLRLRQKLRDQAIRDPLTNLFNHRYMEETLLRELHRAQRRHTPVTIMMLDLDNFKRFNDTYGHAAGDALLRQVAEVLSKRVRGSDIACRYGGDEFILVLPDAGLESALPRAEEIRECVGRTPIRYRGQSLPPVTVSIGLASYPQQGAAEEAVLRAADAALYHAKAHGRDQVVSA